MDNQEQTNVIVVDEAELVEAGEPVQVINGDVDNGDQAEQSDGQDQVSADSAASDVEVTEAEA